MAQLSLETTRMRFGNTIQLYTPLYISNECNNSCLYCGFNVKNKIKRTTLSIDQVLEEAEIIYQMGFRHILLLTGEDKKSVPVKYLEEISKADHDKFINDFLLKGSAERYLQLAIESCINIGNRILSIIQMDKPVKTPETYADIFYEIGALGILPQDFIDTMIIMVRFRNRIVHMY